MITRTKVQTGAPAPPSGGGTQLLSTLIAGAVINGQRVLMTFGSTVVHFDPTVDANYEKIVGMSNQAALLGDPVDVITDGIITTPGWGLTPDTVYYADVTGLITATPPVSGISVIIGVATDADSLKILNNNSIITI